jgi:uncharacterized protein (TIGR02452 family)
MNPLRDLRTAIYKENCKIITATPAIFNIKKPHKYTVDIIKRYNPRDFLPKQKSCRVECVNLTSNQAINQYCKKYNIAVLNFASASNVGGGYVTGAMAQEEELCRAIPDLYPSLLLDDAESFYWDRDIDFSEDLTVYRKDMVESGGKYDVITGDKPKVSVITSSAPNLGGRNIRINQMFERDPDFVFAKLKDLIKSIILTPIITNPDKFCSAPSALILGAFGCGVFAHKGVVPRGKYAGRNYNEVVAILFAEVLMENQEISKAYDVISFAIPRERNVEEGKLGNFDAFKNVILGSVVFE